MKANGTVQVLSGPTQTELRSFFDGVYDSELGYIWNTLRRLGIPDRDLEDVAHDVFVVVHRKLADFDRSRPIRPWLFGIAFRVASRYRRKFSQSREALSDPPEPRVESTAEQQVARREARELVNKAIDSLEFDRRAVFVMCELDAVAVPQIAETLGIPLNTAYSRLRLARRDFSATVRRLQLSGGSR